MRPMPSIARPARRTSDRRRFGARTKPYVAPALPDGKINRTDFDSGRIKSPRVFVQGYNAQAAVDRE